MYLTILTMGNILVGKKASVHIHGKVHHVCFTEEVQFSIKQLLFIVDLKHNNIGNQRWGMFCSVLLSNLDILITLLRVVQNIL